MTDDKTRALVKSLRSQVPGSYLMRKAADTIEAQADVARAMLAALEYLVAECDQDMDQAYNPHAAPLARARAAIAQAKAVGIEETT